MQTSSKALREKRAETIAAMELMSQRLKDEKRSTFSEEERHQFDQLDKEQETLLATAEDAERVERLAGLNTRDSRQQFRGEVLDTRSRFAHTEVEERNKAFAGWAYHGTRKAKRENWQAAERMGIDVSAMEWRFDWRPFKNRNSWDFEQRDQTIIPMTAGGATVAVDNVLMDQLDIALKRYGNIFEVATVIDTPTAGPLPWPTLNDTSVLAEVTPEAGTVNEKDMTFAQRMLSAFKYDSGMIRVSYELESSSILNLAALIGKMSGIRFGRALNADIIQTGAGGTKGITPLVSIAPVGQTTASNSAIVLNDLLTWHHSVDPAYRDEPGCCYIWHDSTLQAMRAIVDTNGRPLLNSSLEGISGAIPQMRQTLLEKPFFVNQAVQSYAAGNTIGFFGDLSKLIIRRVSGEGSEGGLHTLKLVERFADKGEVAYFTWGMFDALLSDAGTHPVKALVNHS